MSIPDLDHIENVILWMSYADEDFGLANYAMKMPGSRPYRFIAYHAVYLASNMKKTIRKILADDGMTIEEDTIN